MTNVRRTFLATASAVALLAAGTQAAIAQDTPAPAPADEQAQDSGPVEKVTVTGSRIKRPTYTSSLPTATIDSKTLEQRQNINVLDALTEVRNTNAGATPTGAQAGFGAGSQFVSLFGLGTNRTLTLVNGRRFVGGNQATIFGPTNATFSGSAAQGLQVDLNAIPTAMIERIEIVSVGGAPTYGADAIGGVVNIILKDDFEGYQVDGFVRENEIDAGGAFRYRGVAGWNIGDGNITVGYERSENTGLLHSDSPFANIKDFPSFAANPLNTGGADGIFNNILIFSRRLPALTDAGGMITLANGLGNPGTAQDLLRPVDRQLLRDRPGIDPILAINPNSGFFTRPATAAEAALGTAARPITQVVVPLQFTAGGDLVPFNIGQISANFPLSNTVSSGGDGLDLAPLTSLEADIDRSIYTALANYNITDSMKVFFEGLYTQLKAVEVVNQPTFQSSVFGAAQATAFPTGAYTAPAAVSGPVIIPNTNPFLTPQAQGVLAANGITEFRLQRANTDLNEGTKSPNEGETYRFVFGTEGDFMALNRLFDYDFALMYVFKSLPMTPSLYFGYALGEGDGDFSDGVDGNFRQSGLQRNNDRFDGVAGFRYYGTLMRPELSNMQIWTAGVGVRPSERSSVDLLFHSYRQDVPFPLLRDSRLRYDPNGVDPDLGVGIDLVVGLEDWRPWEFEIDLGWFSPGGAFTDASAAWYLLFQAKYSF